MLTNEQIIDAYVQGGAGAPGLRAVEAAVRADQIEKDAAHILVVAAENAKAQRESDLLEGIKPTGTSTPLEAEWYQYGNWAAAAIRAQLTEGSN